MYRRGTIDPEIQEQIDYIAAKERARSASQSVLVDDARYHRQTHMVCRSVGTMSNIMQQTLVELRDITTELHTYAFEILNVARALDGEDSPHLNRLTTVAQGMIAIMSKSSNAESIIQETKEAVLKDLDTVGLTYLAPKWDPAFGRDEGRAN